MRSVSAVRLREFWKWFESKCAEFGAHFENGPLLDELDRRIQQLGPFGWEVGPGAVDPSNSMLALSPDGSRDSLECTRAIVNAAPRCPAWEFYAAKPRKAWQQRFLLEDAMGREQLVDGSAWRYVLHQRHDNLFDILVETAGIEVLPQELKQTAAEVLVDGEIGEELRMSAINRIEAVDTLANNDAAISRVITYLFDDLSQNSV